MKFACIFLLALVTTGRLAADEAKTNAPAPVTGFKPEMRLSTYETKQQRDPFYRPGQRTNTVIPDKTGPTFVVPPSAFHLQAILYERRSPSALINNTQVEKGKTVTFLIGGTAVPAKAVEITPDRVILDVQGQKIELQLEEATNQPSQKKKP